MIENNEELPEGWVRAKVADLFKIAGGGTPLKSKASFWNGNIPWLSSGDIKTERISSAVDFITDEGLNNSSANLYRAGTVIIVVRSGILKHTLPVAILDIDAAINQDIRSLDSGNRALNAWLALALRADANAILEMNREGTTVQSVKTETIRSYQLLIPPLAEQRRIVAAVEALLTQVNAIRDRLNRVPTLLKRFRQAILAAACDGRLTADWREKNSDKQISAQGIAASEGVSKSTWDDGLPESWVVGTISSTSVNIVDCPHSTPKWTESGRVCIRTTNFLPGLLDLGEVRYVSEATYIERTARLVPKPNDIVYSREGGILGIACMIPDGLTTCLGQRMMLIRTHEWMNPTFVMHVLNCPQTLLVVKELTGGTAAPHLNVGDVKGFQIPIPPLPEQHEIVRRVNTLFALADQIDAKLTRAKQRVDKLTQAILAKTFRGELVPTEAELARREGREYESAEELLARVQRITTTESSITNAPRRKRVQGARNES